MTAVDAHGRDRVVGPRELVYGAYRRRTTVVWLSAWGIALMVWFVGTTQEPSDPAAESLAMAIASVAFLIGLAVLPARLVIGALRAAAEAAGE